ncbi:MAG: hypothetical protein AAF791_02820 [Bacteroidota bacterium]
MADLLNLEPFIDTNGHLSVRCAETKRQVAHMIHAEVREGVEEPQTVRLRFYTGPLRDYLNDPALDAS